MIKTNKLIVMLALIVGLNACNQSNERQTPSGLSYTLVEEGQGEVPKDGEYMVLNMIYKDSGDSVWIDTSERGFPMVIMKQDSLWKSSEGSIEQVFIDLKEGDSVQFEIATVDLFKNTWKAPIPAGVDSTGNFEFIIGVDQVLTEEGFRAWQQEMMAKQQKLQEEKAAVQLEEDIATIDAYLEENNIEAQTTESGIRYVITEAGNGEKAEAGDKVKVNYAGYVLNGEYFDTSIKEIAEEKGIYSPQREPYEPFTVTLGTGSVIKGWDEGLTYLTEGAEATLYVPSPLAYGPRARSATIGPNAILVFDVELVDVEKGE